MRKPLKHLCAAALLLAATAAHAGYSGDIPQSGMERLINQEQLACSGTLTGAADNLDTLLKDWGDARLNCSGNASPLHATTLRNLMGLRWMITSVSHEVSLLPNPNGRSLALVTVILVMQRNLFTQSTR